jgi:hypothetical protein
VVPRRYTVFFWLGPLLALSWLTLSILDPDPGGGVIETLGLGYFFGSLFGHTTLAAAWTAFGPAPLVWRLPISLTWVFLLATAIGINLGLNGGPDEAVLVIGGCLFGQWLLLQFPLWGLALGYGLRLRHVDDDGYGLDHRERQFGIRQLMIVTTIVGVVFGIGRLVVGQLRLDFGRGEAAIFIFLAVAAIVLTLPLLLAALMRRFTIPAVLVALVLIGLATTWELPLLQIVHRGPGPKAQDLVAINAITAAIMLTVLTIVRLNGYSLAVSGLPAKG